MLLRFALPLLLPALLAFLGFLAVFFFVVFFAALLRFSSFSSSVIAIRSVSANEC